MLMLKAAKHSSHVCLALLVKNTPAASLLGSDALAGSGVRAIRYALEAGGPVEVVANDLSLDACQGENFPFRCTVFLSTSVAMCCPASNDFGMTPAHIVTMTRSVNGPQRARARTKGRSNNIKHQNLNLCAHSFCLGASVLLRFFAPLTAAVNNAAHRLTPPPRP